MSGCNTSSSPSPFSQLNTITVSELERATGEYRGHYVSFSIKVDSAVITGDYRLALRATNETKPGATDIRNASATIVRTLSTTPINVFMSFHMDTVLFDLTSNWTNAPYKGPSTHLVSKTEVDKALLQTNTGYVLYAVKDNGMDNTVHRLLDFRTDGAIPSGSPHGAPTATHTIRNGEPFLYWAYIDNPRNYSITAELNSGLLVTELGSIYNSFLSSVTDVYYYSFDLDTDENMILSKSVATGDQWGNGGDLNKKEGEEVTIAWEMSGIRAMVKFVVH